MWLPRVDGFLTYVSTEVGWWQLFIIVIPISFGEIGPLYLNASREVKSYLERSRSALMPLYLLLEVDLYNNDTDFLHVDD